MSRSTTSAFFLVTVRTILLSLLVSNLSLNMYAQVVGGTIQGTITDPKGAVLPDVKIAITNLSTQIVTSLTSDADGFYTVPNLLPGDYSVTATRSGFATSITQVTLAVGAQRVVNVAMRVGSFTEVVKVQSETAEV
jgi:hypothetical protein